MQCIFSLNKFQPVLSQNIKGQSRPLFFWLTEIFNRPDDARIKEVGSDRACAEWLLRNGASVRWKGFPEYLKDYNNLPAINHRYYIEAVDSTESSIHYIGFPHFEGCKHIQEIKLVNCKYIEDTAIEMLAILKDTLKKLDIVGCKGVSEKGLVALKVLQNLEELKISGLPYVRNESSVKKELSDALPNCKIDFQ